MSGEALACGTPVVVYDTTACPECVAGNTGIVMSDYQEIVPALQEIFERNSRIGRDVIRRECCDFVHDNFDLKTNIQKYIALFDKIINSGEAGRI